ncbi:MAG: GntR family transcriptional regulator, partial [Chloroflexota bacterium]
MAEESIRIKTTDRPLYLLAVDALQGMIKREYSPGDQLPSEEELGGMLGISRSTLRVALGILEQKEQITRKRGAGTFVSSSPAEILSGGLQYIQSILSLAKNIGLSAKMVGFQSNRIPAAEKLAGIL